jgi:hypothetical protein
MGRERRRGEGLSPRERVIQVQISFAEVRRFVDRIPIALLERYRALPYAEADGFLILATDRAWTPLEVDDVTFRTGRRVRLNRVPASATFDRMLFAVAKGISLDDLAGEMEIGCHPGFRLKCPLNWFELEKTEDELARFCRVCDQTVHLATSSSDRQTHHDRGHCVAFREMSQQAESTIDMGYVVDVSEDE